MTLWRNGSASDSRSEGCVFKSRQGHVTRAVWAVPLFALFTHTFSSLLPYLSKGAMSRASISPSKTAICICSMLAFAIMSKPL